MQVLFIGTMLQIKPLLTFKKDDYQIVSFDKVRSMKRAVKKAENITIERINNSPIKDKLSLAVYNSNDLEQATKVKNDFQAAFPNMTIKMFNFSSVIATYLGEKSLGITWMADIDKMDFSKKIIISKNRRAKVAFLFFNKVNYMNLKRE